PFYFRLDLVYHTLSIRRCLWRCLFGVLSICSGPGSGDDLNLFSMSDFGRSDLVGVEEV
ncbi:hypothetical protein ASPWEDRAFT_39516, partial [Aspergillus wentii DTO 134E9]